MSYFVSRAECQPIEIKGGVIKPLLNAAYGCVAGFCSGISFFTAADYLEPEIHADWKGFFVMEGEGRAKVGDEEYRLEPDVCFCVPAGVQACHQTRPAVRVYKGLLVSCLDYGEDSAIEISVCSDMTFLRVFSFLIAIR